MDTVSAWMGGFLTGTGILGFMLLLRETGWAMICFLVFVAGVAVTYWADAKGWPRDAPTDRPQRGETASAARQS